MTLPLWRRAFLAVVSLAIAAALFHGPVAQALIVRGDEALRVGDRPAAVRYYRRALVVDPACVTAADRLAFYLAMRRTAADAQSAVAITSDALARTPANADLFADRALAEQILHRWAVAEQDFMQAAATANDPRYDHLAGRVALFRGHSAQARHHFESALRRDPRFSPARIALAALR